MKNLVTPEAINEALEYVDEDFKQRFSEVMQTLSVKISSPMEYYDEENNFLRSKYRVYLTKDGKTISFVFHDSAHNYQNGNEPTLYDILTCVGHEGTDSTIEFENFEGFCAEYGYEVDSRKAYKIWVACNKQQEKIRSILDLEELEGFPQ